jgi:hypothetical protein
MRSGATHSRQGALEIELSKGVKVDLETKSFVSIFVRCILEGSQSQSFSCLVSQSGEDAVRSFHSARDWKRHQVRGESHFVVQ